MRYFSVVFVLFVFFCVLCIIYVFLIVFFSLGQLWVMCLIQINDDDDDDSIPVG